MWYFDHSGTIFTLKRCLHVSFDITIHALASVVQLDARPTGEQDFAGSTYAGFSTFIEVRNFIDLQKTNTLLHPILI